MTSLAISVRELSTPCHLAHGLLDYAQYLTRTRDAEGAAAAIKEARAIAGRLRCQPLLDRAADIAPAKSAVQDQVAAVPDLEEPTGPAGVTPAAAPRLRRTGHVQNDPYGPRIWPRASRSLGYRTAGPRALSNELGVAGPRLVWSSARLAARIFMQRRRAVERPLLPRTMHGADGSCSSA